MVKISSWVVRTIILISPRSSCYLYLNHLFIYSFLVCLLPVSGHPQTIMHSLVSLDYFYILWTVVTAIEMSWRIRIRSTLVIPEGKFVCLQRGGGSKANESTANANGTIHHTVHLPVFWIFWVKWLASPQTRQPVHFNRLKLESNSDAQNNVESWPLRFCIWDFEC